MLEHAHQDDAVVATALLAVVAEVEAGSLREAGFRRPRLTHQVLLGAECHAGDVGAGLPGEVKPQSAPARADVEDPEPRPVEQQLRRDVALLTLLGDVQGIVRTAEIGARVLAVAVQEQLVEFAGKVVVVGNVAPGPVDRIALLQSPADALEKGEPWMFVGGIVARQDLKKVVDCALLDRQQLIHVRFANRETRVQSEGVGDPT
jgi:hypothetical protein